MIGILVPLDGSRLAEQAIRHAAAIATAYPAELTLLRVISELGSDRRMPIDCVDLQLERRQVEAYLENLARELRAAGIRVNWVVQEGKAAETISRYAADAATDLVVLSRFGRGGITDFGGGSVALKVVATCPVCVLVVGASAEDVPVQEPVRYERILVPVDGSLSAEWALGMSVTIAAAHDATLYIVQIVQESNLSSRLVQTRDLEEALNRMHRSVRAEATRRISELKAQLPLSTKFQTNVVSARDVASALYTEAEKANVDLIVMSAHGDRNDCGWRYGPVCESLLAHTRRPVLVLQQTQVQFSERFRCFHLGETQVDAG